jgi:hypothetical protein
MAKKEWQKLGSYNEVEQIFLFTVAPPHLIHGRMTKGGHGLP